MNILYLGMEMQAHGQDKKPSKHNFWTSLSGASISTVLLYMAVYHG